MKKLIIVSEKEKQNIIYKAAEKLFLASSAYCRSGFDAEKIIDSEKPDFLFIDIIKPVNGIDLMSMLRHIDGNIRLRVAILHIAFPKFKLFHFPAYFHTFNLKKVQ